MSFANLKKQSKLGSLTAKLVKEVEKMNNTGGSTDDRLWKLDVDKGGNGYAIIRFLPAPNGEDLPFVKLYSHAFQRMNVGYASTIGFMMFFYVGIIVSFFALLRRLGWEV